MLFRYSRTPEACDEISNSNASPSPPRCRPAPPLPRRISRRITRMGARASIISTGVLPRLPGNDIAEKPFRFAVAPCPPLMKFTTLKGRSRYFPNIVTEEFAEPEAQTRSGSTADKRSEEHTSELQSLMRISYAVFCLKKKTYIE